MSTNIMVLERVVGGVSRDLPNSNNLIPLNALEKKVNEGGNPIETAIDLAIAAAFVTGAYNLAGTACNQNENLCGNNGLVLTSGLLTTAAIGGYKLRSIIKRISNRSKRARARATNLSEASQDPEFLERQEIKQGTFGAVRKAAKYVLTVPLGGALGYFPGIAGISALCIYFGNNYQWSADASLDSGLFAGPAVGASAFAEMTVKKQWKRMITTASALLGTYVLASLSCLQMDSKQDATLTLGKLGAAAIIFGLAGNKLYEVTKKAASGLKNFYNRNNIK